VQETSAGVASSGNVPKLGFTLSPCVARWLQPTKTNKTQIYRNIAQYYRKNYEKRASQCTNVLYTEASVSNVIWEGCRLLTRVISDPGTKSEGATALTNLPVFNHVELEVFDVEGEGKEC
jgi:hypothetical protein